MLISKRAVAEFLERELNNSDKAKLFTDEALSEKLARLDPAPDFFTQPRTHQKVCMLLGIKYPYYNFQLDMGLGKSWIALNLMRYRMQLKQIKKFLVVVPYGSLLSNWGEQIETHTPDLTYVLINQSGRPAREQALDSNVNCVVITMAGYLSLTCTGKVDKEGNPEKGWRIDETVTKHTIEKFGGVAFDETTMFRNQDTLPFKAARRLTKHLPYRYGLTGTPFGKYPDHLWPQFFIIDRGETLGETLGIYRAAFFTAKKDYWTGFDVYTFDKKMALKLNEVIKHKSIRYLQSECGDLPPLQEIIRHVTFSDETWAYYEKIIEDLKEARGNFRLLENKFIQMRQLAAGFLGAIDPEGERIDIIFKKNPKLDALIDFIREVPEDRKVVVFHDLQMTGKIIRDRLEKEKLGHVWLYSKTKDKADVQERFKKDKKIRVMLSSTAGAMGNNWQVANYTAFYELPQDPIFWEQMRKRTHRTGQERSCFEYYFLVKNSVDEKTYKSLKSGVNLQQAILDGKAFPV